MIKVLSIIIMTIIIMGCDSRTEEEIFIERSYKMANTPAVDIALRSPLILEYGRMYIFAARTHDLNTIYVYHKWFLYLKKKNPSIIHNIIVFSDMSLAIDHCESVLMGHNLLNNVKAEVAAMQ